MTIDELRKALLVAFAPRSVFGETGPEAKALLAALDVVEGLQEARRDGFGMPDAITHHRLDKFDAALAATPVTK